MGIGHNKMKIYGTYGECTTSRRTNCPKSFMRKYFIFMYLSYNPSIKIVSSENTNPS